MFHPLNSLANRLRGLLQRPPPTAPRVERPYRARLRSLPKVYTIEQRRRAMEYWNGCCAVCGRPPGLWHTVALDHWIPLSNPDCPGTVASNMIPLCHGNDGCNNHKHAKDPVLWLRERMGRRRAARKLEEIQYFFKWMENPNIERAACPYCGKPIYFSQEDNAWQCNYCQSTGAFMIAYGDEE